MIRGTTGGAWDKLKFAVRVIGAVAGAVALQVQLVTRRPKQREEGRSKGEDEEVHIIAGKEGQRRWEEAWQEQLRDRMSLEA